MAYQYIREPLRAEEADALSHACETTQEKLIIWTLIDTGLRVSELCSLTSQHILWQQKALRIQGKGGPYGKLAKHRVVPMSRRIQPLMEHYFAMHKTWFVGPRQVQKMVKRGANRAKITQDVTPHVLRHTFATLALQKNISLAAIQKILGHDRAYHHCHLSESHRHACCRRVRAKVVKLSLSGDSSSLSSRPGIYLFVALGKKPHPQHYPRPRQAETPTG